MLQHLRKFTHFKLNKSQKDIMEFSEKFEEYIRQNYNEITTPVIAFITFENEDGYLRAMSMSKKIVRNLF
jgi:hypothetical protein